MSGNEKVCDLKGTLPELSLDVGGVAHLDPNFDRYFKLYDFARLDGHFDQYFIGSVASASHKIAVNYWLVERAGATVLVTHGLFDHTGLYLHLVKSLLDQGFNVVSVDLPEHGLSSGRYGDLDSFAIYAEALEAVTDAITPSLEGKAYYAVAQSTGAAAVLKSLLRRKDVRSFDKIVLLAPLVRVRSWLSINILYRVLKPFKKGVKRSFSTNSHDPDFCYFLKHVDPLQPRMIGVRWVRAMLNWAEEITAADPISVPVAIIQGNADNTVDAEYNLPLLRAKFPDSTLAIIEDGMHHLVCESPDIREQVFTETLRFLND